MESLVFISYASRDREIAETVCRTLEQQRIGCWIAPRDIPGGDSWDEAIIRGLDSCRLVVLIFSSNANDSPYVKREILSAFSKSKTVIPFRVENVEPGPSLEFLISGVQWLDAISRPFEQHLALLAQRVGTVVSAEAKMAPRTPPAPPDRGTVERSAANLSMTQAAPGGVAPASSAKGKVEEPVRLADKPLAVALLYKRNSQPDDYVLGLVEQQLRAAGHKVFVDRHLRIGVEWAQEIERQVRESDAVIPLISEASLQSEMLSMELQIAHESAAQQFGKPRILPVRVKFEGNLPEPFYSILGRLQYAVWNSQADDAKLTTDLLDSLEAKEAPKPAGEPPPQGVVPLDSKYYIVQPTDLAFLQALERQDSIVLVKGARQMGKTSLLARGLQKAREAAKKVVVLDYQKLNQTNLASIGDFYKSIGGMIADQLDLDVFPEDVWRDGLAPSMNFERYLRREVLKNVTGHFILAMDEVDRLFACPYASEVFGLFRSWHNERANNPDGPWNRLTLAIVYATEAHLFITDQNQSPFNVGTRLELHDFGIEQVKKLNELYESPLRSPQELEDFFCLFNGQPYLTRRGFYELACQRTTVAELLRTGDQEDGPFGDNLRRILVLLARDPALLNVVKGLVHGQPCPDPMSFYRLRSGGLIVGHSASDARFRCGLYERYLTRHLS